jgi:hypothetical protein
MKIGKRIMKRKGKVYWFKGKKGQKDILLFNAGHEVDDAGCELGSIYIYELKEELPAKDLEKQVKKYGYPQTWNISPE